MKKPRASGRIGTIGNPMVTLHRTTFTSRSVPHGVDAQAAPRDRDAAEDEAEARERDEEAPGLDRHERQPVGVHERQEDPAQEVVEGREEEQREQSGHEADRGEGAPDIDDARRALAPLRAFLGDVDGQEVRRPPGRSAPRR